MSRVGGSFLVFDSTEVVLDPPEVPMDSAEMFELIDRSDSVESLLSDWEEPDGFLGGKDGVSRAPLVF